MEAAKITLATAMAIGLLVGSSVGVAAQDESEAEVPAWVTGTVEFAYWCEEPTLRTVEGVVQHRGIVCEPQQWTSSDPRFHGTATVAHDSDAYTVGEDVHLVTSAAFRVRAEAGGWDCTDGDALNRGRADELFASTVAGQYRMNCVGTDDYAGTTAILFVDYSAEPKTFEGLAFPGAAPPLPEPVIE